MQYSFNLFRLLTDTDDIRCAHFKYNHIIVSHFIFEMNRSADKKKYSGEKDCERDESGKNTPGGMQLRITLFPQLNRLEQQCNDLISNSPSYTKCKAITHACCLMQFAYDRFHKGTKRTECKIVL